MASTIKHFENGAKVWVKLKNVTYAATVLARSDISTIEHAYEVFKVELQQEIPLWDGTTTVRKWTHPKPVQGYKLKRRVE